jgi:glycosyltransferase involved in cell wall biosynthesis
MEKNYTTLLLKGKSILESKMKPKNILLVAPSFIPTSKDSVAGIEQMVYVLGKALVEQGNNVYTIAREDSEVYGKLIPGGFKDITGFPGAESEFFHQVMNYTASQFRKFIRENDIDVIIDRCQGVSLIAGIEENSSPVICGLDMESKYSIHPKIFEGLKEKIKQRSDRFAAVSNHIAEEFKEKLLNNGLESRISTIYNGIVTENFPFSEKSGDYLLYLGRIRSGKAPHLAIKAALETGNRIIVAGGNKSAENDTQYEDTEYFQKEIYPLLNDSVEWFGPADLKQKVELMRNAKGVLFPSTHTEAFPLVPIESMLCGTPVIAYNHSGAKEEIVHGKTGFLVDSFDEFKSAINKLGELKRVDCNTHAREKFDYRKMGEKYLQLINQLC